MDNTLTYDTIVIGAGVSGLSAARKLESYGENVLVIEAQDRVGGRTLTVTDKHGSTDLGGAYIGPTQNRVFRLVKELGLKVYNVHDSGSNVLDLKSVFGRFTGDEPPFWNPIKLLDLNNFLRSLDNMAKHVPKEAPWRAKKAKELDSITMSQFMDQIIWTRSVRELMDIFMQGSLCAEPCEASLLGALWYIHAAGGITRSMSVSNGAQEKKIDGGAQQLSERMAETLTNGVKARHVISAVPVSLINKITFDPPMPAERIQMYQRIPMGCVIKTFMFYESTFWRDMGLNGSLVSKGVCSASMDDAKPDGSHPAIMGLFLADRAREASLTTAEARKKSICEIYARAFDDERFVNPTEYKEYNWSENQYAGGCYSGVLPPKFLTQYGRYLREPMGRIYFAGTLTATEWAGYIDGAIQAGERAACQILHKDGKIEESEIWKEEPASLEYPGSPIQESLILQYLPSVSTLYRLFQVGAVALLGFSLYFFLYGWLGPFTGDEKVLHTI